MSETPGGGCETGEISTREGKKLLGVVASLRPGGNSEMLTRVALQAAAERGAQTDVVFLGDLRIEFCDGCLSCVFRGQGCKRSDDVAWLYETAAGYDGVIVASPTYILSVPGQVKTLIDRSVAEFTHLAKRHPRPTGTIIVAGLPGWDQLVRPMTNQLGMLLGGRLVGSMMAYAPGPGETLLNGDLVRQARELGVAVLEDHPLPPPEGACPVCHFPSTAPGPCPFCAFDPLTPDAPHRFSPAGLAMHLAEWMLPTRERYLAHRAEVKAAKASLPAFELGRLRPGGLDGRRAPGDGRAPGGEKAPGGEGAPGEEPAATPPRPARGG